MLFLVLMAIYIGLVAATGGVVGVALTWACGWGLWWFSIWAGVLIAGGIVATIASLCFTGYGAVAGEGGPFVGGLVGLFLSPLLTLLIAGRSILMAVACWIGTSTYTDGQWDTNKLIVCGILTAIYLLTRISSSGSSSSKS